MTDAGTERMLVVGIGFWPWYEGAIVDAVASLGVQVRQFSWASSFLRPLGPNGEVTFRNPMRKAESIYGDGPGTRSLNRSLLRTIDDYRPDYIFFYNVRQVFPMTLEAIRARHPRVLLSQYVNDNPFSPSSSRSFWRHLVKGTPLMDMTYCFRQSNIQDFKEVGSRQTQVLMPYFVPSLHFPEKERAGDSRSKSHLVFAGHYEDDGRLQCLEALMEAGHEIRLFGSNWQEALPRLAPASPLAALIPTVPVFGDDYRRAMCRASAALCFLSGANQDVYTTRNFEIPAMGVPLISQRSPDLEALFRDGQEVLFFQGPEELVRRVEELQLPGSSSRAIGEAGRVRVWSDRHSVGDRATRILSDYRSLNS
jgi:hypothetical protein